MQRLMRTVLATMLIGAVGLTVWLLASWRDGSTPPTTSLLPDGAEEALPWPTPRPPWEPPTPPIWARVSAEQKRAAAEAQVPVAFENHLGMRFVLIPGGTFRMGSPSDERGRGDDERARDVTLIEPFYLQTTEVTNGQLRQWDAWGGGRDHSSMSFRGRSLDDDAQPAVHVSWETAARFARWLSNEVRLRRFVLPNEAQWERACRAGTTTRFWWGDDARKLGGHASARVASRPANPWGLHDMAGNVLEWCADRNDGPRGKTRVIRGGSWLFAADAARSAARLRDAPTARSLHLGFRLASPLPERNETRTSTRTGSGR